MEILNLATSEAMAIAAVAFVAGVIRGFTGFALSAVAMVVIVLFLPPVEIIPMLWWLELTASLLMVRSGWREADRRVSIGLVGGSALGLPIGLWLTISLPADISKLVALAIVCALATLQLAKIRLRFLASTAGLTISGLTAGIVTGLSGAGGMVVALYVLALDLPARVIRASLVLYLFVSLCVSLVTHSLVGTMDMTAIARGISFAIPTAVGVVVGKALFVPRYEPYYKPICLGLLIMLALIGLVREGLG